MPNRKFKTKEYKRKSVLITTLFFLLSLPFVLYGVIQKTLDTRSKAFEELELSQANPCIISLPNVNPYTLEIGKSVRVQVDAKLESDGITNLKITDSEESDIHSENFENAPLQIATSFVLTPTKSGLVDILGSIETISNAKIQCKISSPYNIKGVRAIENNSAPEFTSEPSASSKPSQNITTGVQYSYTLTAKDVDGDRINFFYSFTPKATWLKDIVLEDGANGKLKVTFKGTPDKPASYLAHVVIHDGYSKHVRSQSWVISVGQSENDTPIIRITNPLSSLRINHGSEFKASWNVSDLNHIPIFDLFMSKNPTDEETWIKMGESLPYNTSTRNISTEGLEEGTYKLIVKATDNQKPPKTGIGISPEIIISKATEIIPIIPEPIIKQRKPLIEDLVILQEPQVTNMSPSSTDEITNKRVTIKGTIIGSEKGEIEEDSIIFKIDDKDITENIKINKLSKREYTLIYQPEEDLENGLHRAEIAFKDSSGKEVKKSWEFTISSSTEEEDSSYKIFGKEISKRTLFIIGVGFLLIIVAIAVPILISLIWGKGSKLETKATAYSTRNTPERDNTEEEYVTPTVNEDIHKKVNSVKQKNITVTQKDNYTAPKDIDIGEKKEELIPTQQKDTTNIPPKSSTTKPTLTEEKKEKEPTFKPIVHVQKPVTKSKETAPTPPPTTTPVPPSTTSSPAEETKKEEPVFKPTVHVQKPTTKEESTIPTPTPMTTPVQSPTHVEEEKNVKSTRKPEDITPGVLTTPTTPVSPTTTEEIQEPKAPDPAIFQAIAAQIEEQQTQEAKSQPTPNTPA
ncbi:MAG: hypothetical protein ACOX06_01920 [Candidatus Dojkabacteria bacterium]|jgi:hypothetical protein